MKDCTEKIEEKIDKILRKQDLLPDCDCDDCTKMRKRTTKELSTLIKEAREEAVRGFYKKMLGTYPETKLLKGIKIGIIKLELEEYLKEQDE